MKCISSKNTHPSCDILKIHINSRTSHTPVNLNLILMTNRHKWQSSGKSVLLQASPLGQFRLRAPHCIWMLPHQSQLADLLCTHASSLPYPMLNKSFIVKGRQMRSEVIKPKMAASKGKPTDCS